MKAAKHAATAPSRTVVAATVSRPASIDCPATIAVVRTTIDAAGAVVATDCASTSMPDSRRRPRARSGDKAGRSGSRAVKDCVIASESADMAREAIGPVFPVCFRGKSNGRTGIENSGPRRTAVLERRFARRCACETSPHPALPTIGAEPIETVGVARWEQSLWQLHVGLS